MATSQTNLRVRISADLADIKQGLGLLRGELAKVKGQADKALGNNTGLLNGLRGMRSAVVGLAGALGAGLSGGGLIRISDEAKEIASRLKLATDGADAFNRAQRETFEIAQRTRTGLKATAELYARIERSTRDLGLNAATLATLTETINQAAQISGGGPGADAALFQLSQGLASGQLRGEELNSVLEQTPRLAQAIADGMKIPIGALRTYAKEGKLSAEEVLRALLSQREVLAKEFAELPETIAGGFTRIRNAFLQYVATSDQADKTSSALANALRTIAEHLPTIINAFVRLGAVVAAYLVTFKLLPGLYRTMIGLTTALTGANTTLAASFAAAATRGAKAMLALRVAGTTLLAFFAGWQLGKFLREEFVEVRVAGIYLAQSLHKVAVSIAHYFTTAGPRIKLAMLDAFNFLLDVADKMNAAIIGVLEKIPGPIGRAYAAMRGKSKAFLAGLRADTSEVAAEVAKLDAELAAKLADINDAYGAQVNDAYADAAGAGRGSLDTGTGDVSLGSGGGGGKAIRGAVDEAELAADAIKRLLAELDRQFKAREISVAEYFRRRTQLQLQAIDLEIAQARAEAATAKTTEQQSAALTRIVKLQRDRAEIGPQAARDQLAAEKELHTERLRQLEEQSQAIQGRLQNTETSIGAQVGAGLMGSLEGERRIREAREAAIAQLRQLREGALAYLATLAPNSPEAQAVLDYLQQLNGGLAQVQASQQKLRQELQGEAVSAFRGLFADMRDDVKSAEDAVKSFFSTLADGIARIIEQRASEAIVDYLFSIFAPRTAAGGAGGGTRVTGPVKHRGGVVGNSGSWTRSLNPLLFGAAPRYHTGGFPGLGADEVAAVLQVGEEVITENDPRHTRNGGRGAGGVVVPPVKVVIENKGQPLEQSGPPVMERMADGTMLYRVQLAAMRRAIASGDLDTPAGAAWGVSRRGQR
jgi:tape measure domain-containing protein